ncbi:MAG: PAS domain S-box protein [Halobacteriales archaeon]
MSAASLSDAEPAEPIHVLHVDDDADFTELAATYLKRADDRFSIHTATTAGEARELLTEIPVDCIVSDYDMPTENGIAFLESVRSTQPDLPFILFTGKGSEEIASEAISAGVTDYLQKSSGTDQYAVLANRIANLVEKYHAELEAERTRSRIEAIAANSNDAIVMIDTESVIRFVNAAIEELLGYSPDQLLGEALTTIMPPRLRDEHTAAMNRYLETGERTLDWTAVEFRCRHADGHEIPVSVSFSEFTEDGNRRFVGIIRDISDRVEMEDTLREREERFRQLAENIREVVWMSDPEKEEILYVNPAYAEIWGRSVESLYAEPTSFLDAIHPADRDRVEAALEGQVTGDYDEQYRILRPDGERRWIHDRAVPVKDDAGEVHRIVGIASDITERKESHRRLETLIDNLPGIVYRCENDREWPMEYIRGDCAALTGFEATALEEGDVRWGTEIIHPDDQDDVWDTVQSALASDEPFELTYRIRTKDGTTKWLWERGRAISLEDGDRAILEGVMMDVTMHKQREQELKQARERMEFALEFTQMVVWDWDVDRDEVTFYPSEEQLYGQPVTDCEEFFDLIHPSDRPAIESAIEEALDSGEPRNEQVRLRSDDDTRWIEAPGKPITDDTGTTRMVGIARDITERKAREDRLRETTARLEALFENSPDMIDVITTEGTLVDVNQRFCDELGYQEAELLGRPIWEIDQLVDADDVRRLLADFDLDERRKFDGLYERHDGSTIPVEVHLLRLAMDGEDHFLAISRDISERKRFEEKITALHDATHDIFQAETEANVADIVVEAARDILDMQINGVAVHDDAENVLRPIAATQRSKELLGEDLVFLPGQSLAWEAFETGKTLHYDDVSTVAGRVNPDTVIRSELLIPIGDYGVILVGSTEIGVFDEVDVSLAETLARHAETALDRVTREQELERSNQLLSSVFETLPVGVTVLDADGTINRANQRAEEVLGLTEAEITGRTYNDPNWQIIDEDGEPIPGDALPFGLVRDTGESIFDYEHGIKWPDGSERWLSINATPLTADGDTVEQVVAAITDITEQREHELTITEQNERLEQFASIVSHDLRNPLAVAQGHLELARETSDNEHLAAIERAHQRMQTLIEDLLTIAREGEPVSELEWLSLADVVNRCWENVETKQASLAVDTDQRIRADSGRLKQLLENLMRNAIEHGGADVTVTVGDLADGSGFYVEDDGAGIPDEAKDRLFEAGYSTTESGTGLGLNIVEEIIAAHDWQIDLADGREGSTRFEISGIDHE